MERVVAGPEYAPGKDDLGFPPDEVGPPVNPAPVARDAGRPGERDPSIVNPDGGAVDPLTADQDDAPRSGRAGSEGGERVVYDDEALVVAEAKAHPTRAEAVMTIERDLLELYRDPTLDTKPELLEHCGGAFYSEEAVLAANRRWLPRFFRDG